MRQFVDDSGIRVVGCLGLLALLLLPFGDLAVPFFRAGFRKVVFSVVIMIIVLFFSKGIMGNKELSFAGLIRKIKAKKAAKAVKTEEGGAA